MLFERIFREFQLSKLRYAVIGGIAVNLHGYNRLTGDLDILLSLDDENVSKFTAASARLGLVSRLPVRVEDFADETIRSSWIRENNLKVFTVHNPANPLEHVDVKIDEPHRIEEMLENALTVQAGDLQIVIVSLDDLIALKKEAGRDRDLLDVRALERIKSLSD